MLLESMMTHSVCIIDDFLCDSSSNRLLSSKINFSLEYVKLSEEAKMICPLPDSAYNYNTTLTKNLDSYKQHYSTHLSTYFKTVKLWDFSHPINWKEPNLAKLLSNAIIDMSKLEDKNASDKLDRELKQRSNSLEKNYNKFINSVTSWLIRVNIIELRNVSGQNENVYLTVNVGDKLFRTRAKPINNTVLKYDELFRHKLENIETYEVLNLLVKITV